MLYRCMKGKKFYNQRFAQKGSDYTFLKNCPPTPPLSQHFAISEKCVSVGLGEGYVDSFP